MNSFYKYIGLFLVGSFCCQACSDVIQSPDISTLQNHTNFMSETEFPYDLTSPTLEVKLPHSLKEISGICLSGDSSLLAIQDEQGILFELSASTGLLLHEKRFGEDNDYEGIALVNDALYVLCSDGEIITIKNWAGQPTINSFKTGLESEHDAEGICYEAHSHSLLIACKGKPNLKNNKKKLSRSVFRYSLKTKKLDPTPAYSIDYEMLKEYLSKQDPDNKGINKMLKKLLDNREELFLGLSDIAIHPISKDIYIPASKGNALLILSPTGQLKHCAYLPPKDFRQPEGICFDQTGNLIIASEGDGKKGELLFFNIK